MKAIRVHAAGGPEVLKLDEIPSPTPKAGEALVKVDAAGLNYIDVYFRTGMYKAELPLTLGMEAGGTVTAVGANVSEVKVGDKVAYTGVAGAYAEQAVVPSSKLVVLPAGVSTKQGAAAMLQGMTAHYLACSTYPLKKGDTCLVHAAAGGVGLLLCQIAKLRGARVIGTVSTDEKAKLAREAGADETIIYTRQDFEAEVKRMTDGKGVQVVYDAVGKTTWDKSLNSLAPRGLIALYGAVERAHRPDRSADLQRQGLALHDPAEPRPLHGDPRGAAAAGRRGAGLGARRQAQAADGVRVPAQGRGRGASRARGPQDDRQGAAHAVTVGERTMSMKIRPMTVVALLTLLTAGRRRHRCVGPRGERRQPRLALVLSARALASGLAGRAEHAHEPRASDAGADERAATQHVRRHDGGDRRVHARRLARRPAVRRSRRRGAASGSSTSS